MQIAIIIHSIHLGPNSYNESETIAKYEIMDGAPVRGLCTEQHFLCVCLIPPSHFLLFILVFLSPPPAFTIFWLSITPLHPTIFMFLPLYHPLQLNFSILLHHTRHPPLPQPSPCFIPHPSSTIPSYPHNLNFSPPSFRPSNPSISSSKSFHHTHPILVHSMSNIVLLSYTLYLTPILPPPPFILFFQPSISSSKSFHHTHPILVHSMSNYLTPSILPQSCSPLHFILSTLRCHPSVSPFPYLPFHFILPPHQLLLNKTL